MTERILSKHRSERTYAKLERKHINYTRYFQACCNRYNRAARRLTKLQLKNHR